MSQGGSIGRDWFYYAGGITGGDDSGGNITGDDRTGANNSARANRNTRQDDGSRTDPCCFMDEDRPGNSRAPFFDRQAMVGGNELYAGTDEYIIFDRDSAAIHKKAVSIDKDPFAKA